MTESKSNSSSARIKARAAVLFAPKEKLQVCTLLMGGNTLWMDDIDLENWAVLDVEIDQPKALEVHVKIHTAGVCGSDLHGHPRQPGTMLDGSNRVWINGDQPCYSMTSLGCWATDVVVHEEVTLPIDKSIPLNRAVLVGCGVMTGVGAAINTAKVEVGSTCVVVGCGGVGLNSVQGAMLNSAGMIIGVDIFDSKLEMAKQFGATHTINAKTTDAVAEVIKLTGGGAHFAIDAIGSARTVEQIVDMIRPGGTAVVVGMAPFGQKAQLDVFTIARDEKCIKGSYYGSARPGVDMIRLLDLYMQKRLKLDELVSKT
ncbi:hypothetical protein HDU93_009070 [Gonapodya sp. JEL0774]|nr:hypothetical protein HDU93_009070 [Gonapodya sp. JEL0774]